MLAILKFDDEDTYYPPSFGVDEPSKWLAEIMTENRITGTFCVMGERAKILKKRGREDILSAIAAHELASHQFGNQKPELLDLLADAEWEDGIEALAKYEDLVTEAFEEAFGRGPLSLTRHSRQWGAQHVALAGQRNMPYLSPVIAVPDTEQPCWYAGALCFPAHIYNPITTEDEAATPEYGIGDPIYSCDEAFQQRFEGFKKHIDESLARGIEFFHIFGSHPSRIRARGFIEGRILANGKQRSVEEVGFLYETTDEASGERAKANFRKICEYIRNHPDIDCRGASEVAKAFSSQPADISRDEMTRYAQEMTEAAHHSPTKGEILLHRTFSPAELLVGMAESLLTAGPNGWLPSHVERKNVMGPTQVPVIGLEFSSLTHAELLELCRQLVDHVQTSGNLPANLHLKERCMGVGQLAVVVSRAYAAQTRYDRFSTLNPDASIAYPEIAWRVDAKMREIMHREQRLDPNLGSDKIAKHTRLQTWTLKPAWLNPPRGRLSYDGRIFVS